MIIYYNKSYADVISLSKYLIVLYLPFFLWWCEMEKWDEVKWGEWHRCCDKVLGHYWPYDNISGRGSFALWDPESSSHDSINDWISEADVVNGCGFQTGQRFHHATQNSA